MDGNTHKPYIALQAIHGYIYQNVLNAVLYCARLKTMFYPFR